MLSTDQMASEIREALNHHDDAFIVTVDETGMFIRVTINPARQLNKARPALVALVERSFGSWDVMDSGRKGRAQFVAEYGVFVPMFVAAIAELV